MSSFAGPGAVELAQRLFALLKAAAVYAPSNAGYRAHAEEALRCLSRETGGGPVVIEAADDGGLRFNGARVRPPPGGWAAGRFLADELRRRGAAGVEFRPGLEAAELDAFVAAFRAGEAAPALSRRLEAAGVRRVAVGAVAEPAGGGSAGTGEAAPAGTGAGASARAGFLRAVGVLEELMDAARGGRAPELERAEGAVHGLVDQVLEDAASLFALSLLERFDRYTYAHCVNVCVYSVALGARLGLERAVLRELGFAALFHDFGKTRLPRELIDKPDELTPAEWELMRRHAVLGALALLASGRPLDRLLARAARVAFEHHLGYDGSGYPALTRLRSQDPFSRVCALADSFDAMISGRVYAKRAMSPHEAVRRLAQKAGSAYDPFLLGALVDALGVYPVGTLLLLEDGETGAVLRNGPDLLRPTLALRGGRRLDLAGGGGEGRAVRRPLEPDEADVDARDLLAACVS